MRRVTQWTLRGTDNEIGWLGILIAVKTKVQQAYLVSCDVPKIKCDKLTFADKLNQLWLHGAIILAIDKLNV